MEIPGNWLRSILVAAKCVNSYAVKAVKHSSVLCLEYSNSCSSLKEVNVIIL